MHTFASPREEGGKKRRPGLFVIECMTSSVGGNSPPTFPRERFRSSFRLAYSITVCIYSYRWHFSPRRDRWVARQPGKLSGRNSSSYVCCQIWKLFYLLGLQVEHEPCENEPRILQVMQLQLQMHLADIAANPGDTVTDGVP